MKYNILDTGLYAFPYGQAVNLIFISSHAVLPYIFNSVSAMNGALITHLRADRCHEQNCVQMKIF